MSSRSRFAHLAASTLLLALGLCGCGGGPSYGPPGVRQVAADGTIPDRMELAQAWDDMTRRGFWFTSQGSRIIPYNWFTWLEVAGGTEFFRSAEHMESLRYLPFATMPENPSGLPIGFAPDEDNNGLVWVGMTCAACHTNQLDYQGTKILIEGAPTLGNFVLFFSELVAALEETRDDDAKYERFADHVLGDERSDGDSEDLLAALTQMANDLAQRQKANELPPDYPEDFTSYARLDAFGNIQNAASAFALGDTSNRHAPTAPVSYPFLWGTHQSDVVQWNASAENTFVIGPLVRNIGEVVGVFGGLHIDKAPFWKFWRKTSYSSSVRMTGLGSLEKWIKELRSPEWPVDVLPGIDDELVADGEKLFDDHCDTCHEVIPRSEEGNDYKAVRTKIENVGTDPTTAKNAAGHEVRTLILDRTKKAVILGDKFGAKAPAIKIAVNGVIGVVIENLGEALAAGIEPELGGGVIEDGSDVDLGDLLRKHMEGDGKLFSSKPDALVYKARPLNGIWATAPYLHNGSIPNLWQLLVRPADRTPCFHVGNREFDPVHVGYDTESGPSVFEVLDEAGEVRAGNSNLGHVYGTNLDDEEKWALIEYLKTL